MSQINKAPPFLELSKSTIQNFDTAELDIENVLSIWTGLTKCSKFIKNGKRLENMSWRIVNRNLVYSNQIRSAASLKNLDYRNVGDDRYYEIGVPLPGSYKPLKNKLNDGDFMSLLSIVADQGFIERPLLSRKRSSNKNLSIRSRNKSNENMKSFENNLIRPSAFRKSSSSKSLKKLNNNQKKKSQVDLPIILPNEIDLYEQPNPTLGFSNNDTTEPPPPLSRSDTSTSIVRGFKPSKVDVKPMKKESPKSTSSLIQSQKHQTKSLFGNHQKATSAPSLQTHQQQPLKEKHSQHQQQQLPKKPAEATSLFGNNNAHPPSQPSLFSGKPKSPLSRPPTGPQTASLFHPQPQQHRSQAQIPQRPKTLFEQVGISPDVKKPLPSKAKRNNVLNNLGMTSLPRFQNTNGREKEKNMFFIESSPSPTDSGAKLHDNRPISPLIVEQVASQSENSKQLDTQPPIQEKQLQSQSQSSQETSCSVNPQISHHHHHHQRHQSDASSHSHQQSDSSSQHRHKSHGSRESSNRSMRSKKKSLFSEQSKPLNFSSDSSISDESDWSSVSETDDDEEYDDKIREQWEHMNFERTEARPQVKRSLLSGLFLSELNDQQPSQFRQPNSSKSSSTTSIKHYEQHQEPLKSTSSTEVELGTSVQSSIQIKHRHSGDSNHDSTVLELSTSKPTTFTSTSNVNVPGIVVEKLDSDNNDSKLKSKLTEHDKPSSSFTNLISQSALNLSNYFASHRRNSFSSIASDRTRTKFKHESNAPPTASTILPTALSTHMFLPNAHQRAKSRLAAVVETTDSSYSASNTRKNSEIDSNTAKLQSESLNIVAKPTRSPVFEIPKPNRGNDEVSKETAAFNISRKLSPTTTRRQMLATELSDSLRKSILWDRKHGMYPTTKAVKPLPVATFVEDDDEDEAEDDDQHADDEEDDDQAIVDQWTKKEGSLTKKKKKLVTTTKWMAEEETDFYNKGW